MSSTELVTEVLTTVGTIFTGKPLELAISITGTNQEAITAITAAAIITAGVTEVAITGAGITEVAAMGAGITEAATMGAAATEGERVEVAIISELDSPQAKDAAQR